MMSFNPIIQVQDDGLFIPEVGHWTLEKYRLVGGYCDIFTLAMRRQWENLVYIDLFAGAGYARTRETGFIFKSSSLIALSTRHSFSKYIFCEKEPCCFEALQSRIQREYLDRDIVLLPIDTNDKVDSILKHLPDEHALSFCFVDPFSLDLNFDVIRELGRNRVDFLILLALNMDAARNWRIYLENGNNRVERFLGLPNWRELFNQNEGAYSSDFIQFLAEQYSVQMISIGYQNTRQFHQIRINHLNVSLYYLAFYSKHERGNHFFNEIERYASPQITLGF